ncbi:hypothetical protein J3Q64DRAFT_1866083, partial [Phycomyces blakesleeanus]
SFFLSLFPTFIIFTRFSGKHTLTLPLLHFYIPPFFFDTRVLTSSDASSSQWPSGLVKMNNPLSNMPCIKNYHPMLLSLI